MIQAEIGNYYEIGAYPVMKFILFGRNMIEEKYFVFQAEDGLTLIISKDEFYSEQLQEYIKEIK